jgi:hypothetical protein
VTKEVAEDSGETFLRQSTGRFRVSDGLPLLIGAYTQAQPSWNFLEIHTTRGAMSVTLAIILCNMLNKFKNRARERRNIWRHHNRNADAVTPCYMCASGKPGGL